MVRIILLEVSIGFVQFCVSVLVGVVGKIKANDHDQYDVTDQNNDDES